MRRWHMLRSRLRSILFRDRRERELGEELQLHVEREIERRVADGTPAHEARQQALRMFGSVESLKEECRDARGTAAWDSLVRDTRHAARRLVRDWRFSVPAVLLLGLGIGANTAIFSVVNATLFRPSPFADSERLVEIYQNTKEGPPGTNTYPVYLDMATCHERVRARDGGDASSHRELSRGAQGPVRSGSAEYATPSFPVSARHPAVAGPLVHR